MKRLSGRSGVRTILLVTERADPHRMTTVDANSRLALSLNEFCSLIGEHLGIVVNCDDSDEPLKLDGLGVYRMTRVLEDLGAAVPEALIPSLSSISDMYHHYAVRIGAERGPHDRH